MRSALQPRLPLLRRHPRALLLRLEQTRRPAVDHHVHRPARLGARVLSAGFGITLLPALTQRRQRVFLPALQMPKIPQVAPATRASAPRRTCAGSCSPAPVLWKPQAGQPWERGLPSLSRVSVTARPGSSGHIIWGHRTCGRITWRRLISGGRHAAPGQHAAKLRAVQSISHSVGRAAASPVMVTSMMDLVHIPDVVRILAVVRLGVGLRLLGFRSRLCSGRRA
jgi:hypothetical protein